MPHDLDRSSLIPDSGLRNNPGACLFSRRSALEQWHKIAIIRKEDAVKISA